MSKTDISRITFLCFLRIFDIPLRLCWHSLLGRLFSHRRFSTGRFAFARGHCGHGDLCTNLHGDFCKVLLLSHRQSCWKINLAHSAATCLHACMDFADLRGLLCSEFRERNRSILCISHARLLISLSCLGSGISVFLWLLSVLRSFFHSVDYVTLTLSIASSVAYVGAAIYCVRWVTRAIREIGAGGVVRGTREVVKDTIVGPQVPWLGIVRKDLRVASRAPRLQVYSSFQLHKQLSWPSHFLRSAKLG